MNKIICTALLIIAGCTLLPGCGASGRTRRLKRMATEYVKEKYDYVMEHTDALIVTTAKDLYEDVRAKRGTANTVNWSQQLV